MRLSQRRTAGIALARLANTLFFVMTALYCLLSYSPFASSQFIKAHLIVWLVNFAVWHVLWYWLALGVTVLTIVSEPARAPGRAVGWGYVAVMGALGVVLLRHSVLPEAENNGRGLILAFAALAPPVWLALADHRATAESWAPRPSLLARSFWACLVAGFATWLEQTVLVPWRLGYAGEITLTPHAIAFGVVSSAISHGVVFGLAALLLFVALRPTRGPLEYWIIAALSAAGITFVTDRIIFATIAFAGAIGWSVSIAFGAAITLVWSGVARRRAGEVFGPHATAMEVWLSPIPGISSRMSAVVILAALTGIGFVAIDRISALDWDFLAQRLCVVMLWLFAFAYSFGALRDVRRGPTLGFLGVPLAAVAVFALSGLVEPRLSAWTGDPEFVPEFTREGFGAVDPSFHLIDSLLRTESAEDAAFYARLRANAIIQHVDIAPVDVDFEKPFRMAADPKPDVFLFLVDSLRRDYLSPYNPRVTFTPAIGRFAADNIVFDRAFTRYGGTALSVAAIWAGGMVIHKEYVKPFGPMNTLAKLLDGDEYRRFMSVDAVVEELIPTDGPTVVQLDRGRRNIDFDFCRTLDELRTGLAATAGDDRPNFGYTLTENIHISHVRSTPLPHGTSYPGFEPHVAWQLERMDACFGSFIDFLQTTGRYDNSIVVLTSDHGDSLGEGLRWGHSYTMFPEVVRVPLLVHLPGRLRGKFRADPKAIALSTDIAPTLYELLGHEPADLGPLFGRPLFTPSESPVPDRAGPRVAVSSYGPVFAVYRDNGTRLYIADGVNRRDYAYDLRGSSPVRIGLQPPEREADRRLIRERIAELARLYRFNPQ